MKAWTAATPISATFRAMVAFVVLAAQLGVAGAGVLDAREGVSAASHLEQGGTNLHFAHNEADCFMCRAQHMEDAAPVNPGPECPVTQEAESSGSSATRGFADAVSSPHKSRAPPAIV